MEIEGGDLKETPPRAWGRPAATANLWCRLRNTPTGVGKTLCLCTRLQMMEKHPHGRGEDLKAYQAYLLLIETPPRAWGRLSMANGHRSMIGNTPTGVGKTFP